MTDEHARADRLRTVSVAVGLVTFVLGATVGYRVGKRHGEGLRLLGAAVGGLIAVPVAVVAGTWIEADRLDGSPPT